MQCLGSVEFRPQVQRSIGELTQLFKDAPLGHRAHEDGTDAPRHNPGRHQVLIGELEPAQPDYGNASVHHLARWSNFLNPAQLDELHQLDLVQLTL
jgi:hypothetical protein